jgi:hypothetical protein
MWIIGSIFTVENFSLPPEGNSLSRVHLFSLFSFLSARYPHRSKSLIGLSIDLKPWVGLS